MRIAELPTEDRPRERLATRGAGTLADRELLAILLGTGGTRGTGAHQLADRLLARFRSVAALARADPADFAAVSGVGAAKAAALAASFELARRATAADAPTVVTQVSDLAAVAAPLLHGRSRERLVLVTTDRAGRVLGCDVLSEGGADTALLPTREVIVAALRRDSAAYGIAHNHPSGDTTPSAQDVESTAQLRRAGAPTGLRFLGHVVVTDEAWREVPSPATPGTRRERPTTTRHTELRRCPRGAAAALPCPRQ